MPKVELETYDGNPLLFHSFFATFNDSIAKVQIDDQAKLTRLLQYTIGEAKAAIRSCSLLGGEEGYKQAYDILKKRFGNHHVIARKMINNLKVGKPIKGPAEFQAFSDELVNTHAILKKMKKLQEIDTQSCIVDIINRFQPYIRNRWKNLAMDHKRVKDCYPDFEQLVQFVSRESDEVTDPVYGQAQFNNKSKSDAGHGPSTSRTSSAHHASTFTTSSTTRRPASPCILCGECHRLFYCDTFKSLKPPQRLEVVKKHKLCENCLLNNHTVDKCRKPSVCSVDGCGKKHTKFIHVEDSGSQEQASVTNCATNGGLDVCVPIVSVNVNNKCAASALLDTASTSSFCTTRLVNKLGIRGSSVKYALSTLSASEQEKCSQVVNLSLMAGNGRDCLNLINVYVIDDIPVKNSSVDLSTFSHLKDLPINTSSSQVDILIGQNNSEALIPLQVKKGASGQPFAVRTLLGWTVNGPSVPHEQVSHKVVTHFITANTVKEDFKASISIEENIRALWDIENECLSSQKVPMSQDDLKVIKLWDENIVFREGHYELPIPWKDNVYVPNNYEVAKSRMTSLRTSLKKRGLMEKYDVEMVKMVDKGYAEKTEDDNVTDKQWYLPHHPVLSEKKPDKLRIVFDCASKYQGESLNDKCLQGPDLNNRLLCVLLRFRQHHYAIMADVEAMYYQVRVPESDRNVLRFLWVDDCDHIVQYRMTSHVFGGVWCACAAIYALRRAVEDSDECDPLVRDVVMKSFYVDDCLKSIQDPDEAKVVIHGARELLAKRGFRLTKFVVNNRELMEDVPVDERAKEVKDLQSDMNSKALGVKWDVEADEFYFVVEDICRRKDVVSRRLMLSVVSSTFDPLGLVSPALVLGRVLFQDATRLKLGWDDNIPEELHKRWSSWLRSLEELARARIPRCIKPSEYDDAYIELHCFSDASERAYGCCGYLRCVNKDGGIVTSLVMSKGKVSPIKTVSIPRLELQAAVMSAQMGTTLVAELDIEISAVHFWVDSEIVIRYIKNETRRFHVYVGNRVSTIRSLTQPDQWHHVAGNINPADLITRGQTPDELSRGLWFVGPDFLRTHKSEWSVESDHGEVASEDPEVKPERVTSVCATTLSAEEHPLEKLIKHYSSWYKLRKAVAWKLKNKVKRQGGLSVDDIRNAEIVILQHVQSRSYAKEIEQLREKQAVGKTSSLLSLSPVIDEDGLLRVGGRLKHADIEHQSKHPCIIPSGHPLAVLIVREMHEIAHLGTEWTSSLIRRKYWIIKARSLIKNVRSKCVVCKQLYAAPCKQRMADLPPEKLDPTKPAFSYIGLDCFGPFYVTQGRAQVKRYGCIYTCLNVRAIHIEKLSSLDTNSFLNGFRRFVARRGSPLKVWSDNGTNIVAGQAELARAVKQLDKSQIQSYGTQREIEWCFNPPHASHMGGFYERMIRVIRRVLSSLLKGCRLTDEVLETAFCEAEAIVNSRPLTKISDDIQDMSVLTPNHLLLLKEGPEGIPGQYCQGDMLRKRWRFVQHLATQFWKRWIRAYLPELQRRQKWTDRMTDLKVGDVVLVCDENMPRCLWPLGLVIEAKVSRDGAVRSVRVQTKSSELVRPITKIVMLEES